MTLTKKIISSLIFVVALTAGLPAVSSAQGISSVAADYVIKLRSADPSSLKQVGQEVTEKFVFSAEPQFQNVYSFSSPLTLSTLKQTLAGKYEYLEYDTPLSISAVDAAETVNDPLFTTNGSNIDKQWGLVKARFLEAWDKTTGSTEVVVAVIDTGIDQTHEDFSGSTFVPGYNVLTGQSLSRRRNSDDNGHGTLISGVIGATANNDIGITGAIWGVSLMPVKALNGNGSGSSSEISEGIVWAADNGADVINLSLGGIGFAHDTTLADAITYAFNKNVVIVAAAGNDVAVTGGNLDLEPVFPICNDNSQNMIIGVTATDVNDLKPDFANFGKACIDVSAPGRRIVSTINHDPATGAAKPDVYAYASGTSLAVPFVSAQAALLKSLFPYATNKQIRDRIIGTVDTVDNLNLSQCGGGSCKGLLGGGRINVDRSLAEEIPTIADGDLVQVVESGALYYINGGKRQFVTPFVLNQRFAAVVRTPVSAAELGRFPEGSYAEPLDGTLVKIANEPTVYYMQKGLRLAVTYQIFQLRGLSFASVNNLSTTEVHSWIEGGLLPPPEGALVRTPTNHTVYWVVGGVLHPINYNFWVDRGLNIFPVIFVSENDLTKFSKGDPYIL